VGASAEGDRGPLWACRSPPTRGAAADGGGRPARRGRALVGDRALGLERVEVVRHRVGLRASWCPRPAPAPARRADPGERRVRRRAAGRQLLLALRARRAPVAVVRADSRRAPDCAAEWQFAVTPGPLTARFFYVRSGDLKSPRDVEIRVTAGGQPTDHAWYVALKTSLVVRSEPKRIGQKGTALKGLGRDLPGVWVGV